MTKGVWRVVQSYNAEADDELSLKIDQLITVLSIEENGWAEGILENQWVGWFPIECAAPDNSQLHMVYIVLCLIIRMWHRKSYSICDWTISSKMPIFLMGRLTKETRWL